MPEPANDSHPNHITRRAALQSTLAAGPIAASFAAGNAFAADPAKSDQRRASPRRFAMKKSINRESRCRMPRPWSRD